MARNSKILVRNSVRTYRAFTLFEVVISTVLVGIVLVSLVTTAAQSYYGSRKSQARMLALSALEGRMSSYEGRGEALMSGPETFTVAGPPVDFRGQIRGVPVTGVETAVELLGEITWKDARSGRGGYRVELKKIVAKGTR